MKFSGNVDNGPKNLEEEFRDYYILVMFWIQDFFEGFLLQVHPRMSCLAEICALPVLFRTRAQKCQEPIVFVEIIKARAQSGPTIPGTESVRNLLFLLGLL